MAIQSGLGLAFPDAYRDIPWIKATWFGNDLVTLAIAVPLLAVSPRLARRGSARARLLWFGALGYAAYNGAFYLLGAALNVYFPLYVTTCVLAGAALIQAFSGADAAALAHALSLRAPVRAVGGWFVFVAFGLTAVWLGMWAAHVFAGRPTPVEPEAFRLVAALDTTLMVPALAVGGTLLWRRHDLGVAMAGTAGIQATLYLLVLTLNSALAIAAGRVPAPGELPVWGGLFVPTGIAATALVWHVRRRIHTQSA